MMPSTSGDTICGTSSVMQRRRREKHTAGLKQEKAYCICNMYAFAISGQDPD